jgi:hypothetical protein
MIVASLSNLYLLTLITFTLLEDEKLNVEEEEGHNKSFILGTGHDSIVESA